jgi:hypothetical protein
LLQERASERPGNEALGLTADLIREVKALIEHRRGRQRAVDAGEIEPEPIRLISIAELKAMTPEQLEPDPVERATRRRLRAIGKHINEGGGFSAMEDACEAVEYACGARGAVIVDHAWNAIGSWYA